MDPEPVRRRVYDRYVTEKMNLVRGYEEEAYRRWSENAYRQLKDWLPKDRSARCLDVGCGHGNVLHMLKSEGYRDVQGIDRSGEQVALARKVSEDVREADALQYLADHENAFDVVLAFDILEHFTRSEALTFLDGVFVALHPGGCLILQTPNADSPWCASERYNDLTHETAWNPNSLENAMRLAGFEECQFRETGPVVHGVVSAIRSITWRMLRLGMQVWNFAETGTAGSGVFTRVFRARGVKP